MSNSPWGAIQSREILAEGIVSVGTAGHGGIIVDAERNQRILDLFPTFTPFCGVPGAYEEDQDWAVVALAYPNAFRIDHLYYAIRTVIPRSGQSAPWLARWKSVQAWLDSPAGAPLRARTAEYAINTGNPIP